MAQFRGVKYGRKVEILPGIAVRFGNAGHILGAAVVELWLTENGNTKKIAFSGDLGFRDAPVMPNADTIDEADVVLLESTYGDRLHRDFHSTLEELASVFAAASEGGDWWTAPRFTFRSSKNASSFESGLDEHALAEFFLYLGAREPAGQFQREFERRARAAAGGDVAVDDHAIRREDNRLAEAILEAGIAGGRAAVEDTGGRERHRRRGADGADGPPFVVHLLEKFSQSA